MRTDAEESLKRQKRWRSWVAATVLLVLASPRLAAQDAGADALAQVLFEQLRRTAPPQAGPSLVVEFAAPCAGAMRMSNDECVTPSAAQRALVAALATTVYQLDSNEATARAARGYLNDTRPAVCTQPGVRAPLLYVGEVEQQADTVRITYHTLLTDAGTDCRVAGGASLRLTLLRASAGGSSTLPRVLGSEVLRYY
jgi:hypothetical protein